MKASPGRLVTLGIGVYATWLLLSGVYVPFLLTIGLLSTIGVVYVARRMDVVDEEGVPQLSLRPGRVLTYIPWFLLEVVKSNLGTLKVVLSPSLPINPVILRVKSMPRTDLGKFILANSITLTPGTVTLSVGKDELYVHALVAELATGMDESDMNRHVAALEKEVGE